MKRFVIIATIFTAAISVNAQDFWGFQIGFAQPISRLNAPTNNELTASTYNGMKVGFVYDATWFKGFGASISLNYTFGGYTTDWKKKVSGQPGNFPQIRAKGQLHQIELPIDWQYKFEIAQSTWIILYTGPTIQYGLALKDKWYLNNGKEITIYDENNIYSVEDMKDYALKHFNVTWGVGTGFQYERYFLRGGYDFGLINPYKAYQFNETVGEGNPRTRGRFDQWQIKLGVYL